MIAAAAMRVKSSAGRRRAVTMKTFFVSGRRIETRLIVNHYDVGWSGYSYEWNDDDTEATLLEDRKPANPCRASAVIASTTRALH